MCITSCFPKSRPATARLAFRATRIATDSTIPRSDRRGGAGHRLPLSPPLGRQTVIERAESSGCLLPARDTCAIRLSYATDAARSRGNPTSFVTIT